jgi:hypothetical protein
MDLQSMKQASFFRFGWKKRKQGNAGMNALLEAST